MTRNGRSKSTHEFDRVDDPSASRTKKRSGKKRRIAIRKKMQAIEEKKSAAKRSQAEKEAAEKEKRTRRNREKKVKRKQKEKMQKTKRTEETLIAG